MDYFMPLPEKVVARLTVGTNVFQYFNPMLAGFAKSAKLQFGNFNYSFGGMRC
jgi:hypothetical protein